MKNLFTITTTIAATTTNIKNLIAEVLSHKNNRCADLAERLLSGETLLHKDVETETPYGVRNVSNFISVEGGEIKYVNCVENGAQRWFTTAMFKGDLFTVSLETEGVVLGGGTTITVPNIFKFAADAGILKEATNIHIHEEVNNNVKGLNRILTNKTINGRKIINDLRK